MIWNSHLEINFFKYFFLEFKYNYITFCHPFSSSSPSHIPLCFYFLSNSFPLFLYFCAYMYKCIYTYTHKCIHIHTYVHTHIFSCSVCIVTVEILVNLADIQFGFLIQYLQRILCLCSLCFIFFNAQIPFIGQLKFLCLEGELLVCEWLDFCFPILKYIHAGKLAHQVNILVTKPGNLGGVSGTQIL